MNGLSDLLWVASVAIYFSLGFATSLWYLLSYVLKCIWYMQDGVVYRGISPDVLMVDRKGRIQV